MLSFLYGIHAYPGASIISTFKDHQACSREVKVKSGKKKKTPGRV